MKKLLGIALTLALALSLSVTAFATEELNTFGPEDKDGKGTTVTYDLSAAYTVTIPAKVELSKNSSGTTVTYEQNATISAKSVRLEEGQTIKVTLTGDFNLSATAESGAYEWPYTVKVGTDDTAIESGGTVATFSTQTEDQTETLHFSAAEPTYAGSYSDTVTFNVSIIDPGNTDSNEP